MGVKPTYDEVAAAYDKLVAEKERYRLALEKIATVDYRGNRPHEQVIAFEALRH